MGKFNFTKEDVDYEDKITNLEDGGQFEENGKFSVELNEDQIQVLYDDPEVQEFIENTIIELSELPENQEFIIEETENVFNSGCGDANDYTTGLYNHDALWIKVIKQAIKKFPNKFRS